MYCLKYLEIIPPVVASSPMPEIPAIYNPMSYSNDGNIAPQVRNTKAYHVPKRQMCIPDATLLKPSLPCRCMYHVEAKVSKKTIGRILRITILNHSHVVIHWINSRPSPNQKLRFEGAHLSSSRPLIVPPIPSHPHGRRNPARSAIVETVNCLRV